MHRKLDSFISCPLTTMDRMFLESETGGYHRRLHALAILELESGIAKTSIYCSNSSSIPACSYLGIVGDVRRDMEGHHYAERCGCFGSTTL